MDKEGIVKAVLDRTVRGWMDSVLTQRLMEVEQSKGVGRKSELSERKRIITNI